MPHTEASPGPVSAGADGAATRVAADGREPTSMLRAAVRPRMLVLLVLLLGAAAVCGRLGVWQLDRAELRGAKATAERLNAQEATPAVALGGVLAPQTAFAGDLVGRRVLVRGVYDAAGQVLVAGRVLGGRTGYLVLTPLHVTDDRPAATPTTAPAITASADSARVPAGTPVLPVVRGWIPTADAVDTLAVPPGEVTVTAYLQSSEVSTGTELPTGQVDAISSAELLNRWGGPIWSAYAVLTASDPAQSGTVALLPAPVRSGTGLNLQNLAYAAQWWIFAGFALFVWLRMVRDEASGGPVTDEVDAAAP